MKRAFTLVELLVVIAIMAVLAAILFPVFARAKEAANKTQAISNVKQTGLSLLMYAGDHDDTFACMYSVARTGQHWFNFPIATPAGWDDNGAREFDDSQAWVNSVQPYAKSPDINTAPGLRSYHFTPGVYSNPNKGYRHDVYSGGAARRGSISANGLLSIYPAGSIHQPSRLTLAWFGNMQEELKGYSFTNPGLYCNGVGPCRFNPDGLPQQGATSNEGAGDVAWYTYNPESDTAWVYGKSLPFVFVDGHAKAFAMNERGEPTPAGQMVTNYNDPAMRYGANGFHQAYHRCSVSGTGVRYLSFFRPDSEFNYEFGNSPETRCSR